MSPAPLLVIAMDSAEPTLLEEGIAEGWLPTLAGVVERGRAWRITGPQRHFPGAAWASAITGHDIPEHRLYVDKQLVEGTYDIAQKVYDGLRAPPFWKHADEAGYRVTVASVYGAPLISGFRGVQVVGWGSHDPYVMAHGEPQADPPEWLARLDREVGRRDLRLRKIPSTPSELRAIRDHKVGSVGQQARGMRLLMAESEWDLFVAAFSEPHQSGHLLWHTEDPLQPGYEDLPEDLRGSMRDIYRALDRAVGELVELAPRDARVVLLTPHGMGPHPLRGDPLRRMLEVGGWLVPKPPAKGGRRGIAKALWRAGRLVTNEPIRRWLGRILPRDRWFLSLLNADIDWSRTKAFPVIPDALSYLRLNVRGREPQGIVPPEDRNEVLDDIEAALGELVDADTGARAVGECIRPIEFYGGKAADILPDLAIRWSTTRRTRLLRSDRLGTIEVPDDDPRTGMHRVPGVMLAAGPGIAADPAPLGSAPEISVLDMAPTVLGMLGLAADLPGTPAL